MTTSCHMLGARSGCIGRAEADPSGGSRLRTGLGRCGRLGTVDVERGCRSKQAYLSKAQAKAISRSMSARHREAFHIYACPSCRYWHVGHIVPAGLRAGVVTNWERAAVRVA